MCQAKTKVSDDLYLPERNMPQPIVDALYYVLLLTLPGATTVLPAYAAAEGAPVRERVRARMDRAALARYRRRDPVPPIPPGGEPDLWVQTFYTGAPENPDWRIMGAPPTSGASLGFPAGVLVIQCPAEGEGSAEGGYAVLWPLTDRASVVRIFGEESPEMRVYSQGLGPLSSLGRLESVYLSPL
jgi:hypothetical protein